MINISVLLDVQANLSETSPFFVCPNGFGEHLLSNVYSILGMYNFDHIVKNFKIFSLTFVSRTMFPSTQCRKIGHLVDNGKTITLFGVEKTNQKSLYYYGKLW